MSRFRLAMTRMSAASTGATNTVMAWAMTMSWTGELWKARVITSPKDRIAPATSFAVREVAVPPRPRASESIVPPAVALATMDEKAAPMKPRAKIFAPTGPASGSKTRARPTMDSTGLPRAPSAAAATAMTRAVMMPGAMMPGTVSAMVRAR